MTIFITGSIAYDTLIFCKQPFQSVFQNGEALGAVFLAEQKEKHFGGCATNIAFHAKLLGLPAYPVGCVGSDFDDYSLWLKKHCVSTDYIFSHPSCYTAQAIIATDIQNRQITFFHPGAMEYNCDYIHRLQGINARLAIVSPNNINAMMELCRFFASENILYILDPGQMIGALSKEQLAFMLKHARYLIVNEDEGVLLENILEQDHQKTAKCVEALIITQGKRGATLYNKEEVRHFAGLKIGKDIDPTGCGDAFRSGLLYGLYWGLDWKKTMGIANLMGALAVTYVGTQSAVFSFKEINCYAQKYVGVDLLENK